MIWRVTTENNQHPKKPRSRRINYAPWMRFSSFIIKSDAPSRVTSTGHSYTCWKCLCDCGVEFVTTTKQIKRGMVKSCGCKSRCTRFVKLRTDEQVIFIKVMSHYRHSARSRKLQFNLSLLQCCEMFKSPCYYCGSPPSRQVAKYAGERRLKENPQLLSLLVNGIDRIDSRLGYTSENTVPCCKICNRAKAVLAQSEFFDWIRRLAAHEQARIKNDNIRAS